MSRTTLLLGLQVAASLLTLAFGVAALRVAGHRRLRRERRRVWLVTGAAFSLAGVHAVLQAALAVAVMNAGSGSRLMRWYMAVVQECNDARSTVLLGCAAALLALPWLARRGSPIRPWGVWLFLAGCMLLGAAGGAAEGPFSPERHLAVQRTLSMTTVAVLLAALYREVARGAMDHLLWLALACYAMREAVMTVLLNALANFRLSAPPPSPVLVYGTAIVVWLVMLVCAQHCLALLRAGRGIPAAAEWLVPLRRPTPARRP